MESESPGAVEGRVGKRLNLRVSQGAATRTALLLAARRLFAEKGYHEAGTDSLVAEAGVTRGALYHHFQDKAALFETVFRQVAGELCRNAALAVEPFGEDRWERLQLGLQVHLQMVTESREMQQILLIDGPAVLGWSRWRELQSEFSLGALVQVMEHFVASGAVRTSSAFMAAHLVLAALSDAALLIADADNPQAAGREAAEVVHAMVQGLRSAQDAPARPST